MKKLMIAFCVTALSVSAFAGPCGGRGCGPCRPGPCHPCGPGWRPGPHPCHYRGGGDWWGRGGRNFWPGFIGGVVGGVVANSVVQPTPVVVSQPVVTTPVVVTQPTVVTQPVVQQTIVTQPVATTQSVWVEGRYVDTVQANGSVVRTWQPGHYEQRTVVQ